MTSVAVLGGGVGGLSAAQELAERGIDVTVYEDKSRFGGKARSTLVDLGDSIRVPLGEHGFRFFPGFYCHITDTMARIPTDNGSVEDELVPTTEMLLGSTDSNGLTTDRTTPKSLRDLLDRVSGLSADPLTNKEKRHLTERLLVLMTSCESRLTNDFEDVSWWDFIGAESMSERFRKSLGRSTQLLVALDPRHASARTIGQIHLQLIRGSLDPSLDAERVLAGPTSKVWIDPWMDYLDSLGVSVQPDIAVRRLQCDGRHITGVTVDEGREITADYYVAALPVEVMTELMTDDLARAAPSLADIDKLETNDMVGIQYLLSEDMPLAHGHELYPDSPWALTSISQQQFWNSYDISEHTDGEIGGVLSVIVSDWNSPGIVYNRPASDCTPEQIKTEVWAQMSNHLTQEQLDEANIVDWTLPPSIEAVNGQIQNREPLLINTAGSLRHRPEADTEIGNLVLAADYVRTNTDLACMEGANEAARRATNAIINHAGLRANPCEVWNHPEPSIFKPAKRHDAINYRMGLPHPGQVKGRLESLVTQMTP